MVDDEKVKKYLMLDMNKKVDVMSIVKAIFGEWEPEGKLFLAGDETWGDLADVFAKADGSEKPKIVRIKQKE